MSSAGIPRRSANLALAQVPTMTPVMIIRLYQRSANGPKCAMTGSISISTRGSMAAPSIAPGSGRRTKDEASHPSFVLRPSSPLPWPAAQILLQLFQRQRVQHVRWLKPAPACDLHAVVQILQLVVGVRVGADHDLHAQLLGPPRIVVADVQAVRPGVGLHGRAGLGRRLQDGFYVHLQRVAPSQHPSGQMADAVHMWAAHGANDALGQALSRLLETRVDG